MNRLFFILLGMIALGAFVPDMMVNKTSLSEGAGKDTISLKKSAEKTSPPAPESVSSGSVKLKAGPGGHFVAEFRMNGKGVTALVDTGASSVAINKSTAKRLGIQYRPMILSTVSVRRTARQRPHARSFVKSRSVASKSAMSRP